MRFDHWTRLRLAFRRLGREFRRTWPWRLCGRLCKAAARRLRRKRKCSWCGGEWWRGEPGDLMEVRDEGGNVAWLCGGCLDLLNRRQHAVLTELRLRAIEEDITTRFTCRKVVRRDSDD